MPVCMHAFMYMHVYMQGHQHKRELCQASTCGLRACAILSCLALHLAYQAGLPHLLNMHAWINSQYKK